MTIGAGTSTRMLLQDVYTWFVRTSLSSCFDLTFPQLVDVPATTVPTARCKVDGCEQNIPLSKPCIRQHLIFAHGYEAYQRGASADCRWEGCCCTKKTCIRRGLVHGVHVEDITEHVWHSHLNFHEVCSRCGEARWVHPYARSRHESKCTGPRPARCKACLIEFSSAVALECHIMWQQCVPVSLNGVANL
jgi:hypothetical protein